MLDDFNAAAALVLSEWVYVATAVVIAVAVVVEAILPFRSRRVYGDD